MKNNNNKTKNKIPTISRSREARLRIILDLVAAGKYPNSTDLARRFGVERKAIVKDIAVLNTGYGQNIDFDFRRNGYYCLTKPKPMPTCHNITEKQIMALNLLKQLSALFKDLPYGEEGTKLLEQLQAGVAKDVDYPKGWEKIMSFHTTAQCLFKPEIFDVVFQSALHQVVAKMLYCKQGPGQKAEKRLVEVHHIANVNNECFVFAWDVDSQKMRTFIPARIKAIESTGKRFKRKKFSIEERLKHSFHIFTGDELHDVRIEFTPKVADLIREKKWGGQQGLRELENGGVELHLKLSSLLEVFWWILKFTGDAIVTNPPQLEEMVIEGARKLLTVYEKRRAMRAGDVSPGTSISPPAPNP